MVHNMLDTKYTWLSLCHPTQELTLEVRRGQCFSKIFSCLSTDLVLGLESVRKSKRCLIFSTPETRVCFEVLQINFPPRFELVRERKGPLSESPRPPTTIPTLQVWWCICRWSSIHPCYIKSNAEMGILLLKKLPLAHNITSGIITGYFWTVFFLKSPLFVFKVTQKIHSSTLHLFH